MSAEQNKAVVRRFHELFDQGDIDGIEALLDPNCIAHRAGSPPLSRDAFKQLGMMFAAAFTEGKSTLEDMVAENDMVCYRGTWSATHRADFNGIPATGKRVTIEFIVMDRFVNGKIIENWEQADMLGLMQQPGIIPAPQAG
ncbi:MAG TPA: ester cyclase [Aggregatilineales bacterium]|nr:ester cyclase [Aggregatilineales bacterium]